MSADPDRPPPALVPALLAASTLTVMAGAVVAAAVPQIADHFADVPDSRLRAQELLTIPGLAVACLAPLGGFLADVVGRTRVLLAGLGLYALAGTTAVYLDDLDAILAGRAGLGVAVALIMTSSSALISDYFHGPARAKMLGLQAASMSLGGVVLLPLGGVLATLGWHAPFLVYLAAVPMLWLAALVPEPPPHRHAEPRPEDVARTPWLTVVGLYAVGLVGMLAFALGPTQVPFHMRERFAAGPIAGAVVVSCMTLASACVGLSFGRIGRRFGTGTLITAMFLIVGAGYSLAGNADTAALTVAALAVTGFGSGLMMPTVSTALAKASPPRLRGRIAGGVMSAIFLGQYLSPRVAGPFVEVGGTPLAFRALGGAMLVVGVVLAAAFGASGLRQRAGGVSPGRDVRGYGTAARSPSFVAGRG